MKKSRYDIRAYCYDKRGRLISEGRNNYDKTHPLQAHFAKIVGEEDKIYLHAEISALLRSRGKQVHKIHVERIQNEATALAEPCPICMEAIKAFGVKVISYTL